MQRGIKQGDPIRPALFNAVLQERMANIARKWEQKGYGIQVSGTNRPLTNLRFADDILLLGRSPKQVTEMLDDLICSAQEVGLEIHAGKTKILSNGIGKCTTRRQIFVRGRRVEILPPWGSTAYLGRALCLSDPYGVEIESRMRKAWAKFNIYKSEITDPAYSMKQRMNLFNAVVTQTALYGSSAWAMTCAREQKLRVTQRKMLRCIIGDKRMPSEDADAEVESYVEWIKRCTGKVKDMMADLEVPDWVELQRTRKWNFVAKQFQEPMVVGRNCSWPPAWSARGKEDIRARDALMT